MILSDKKKFLEIMTSCSSVYRQEADKSTMRVFWQLLEAYPIEAVEKAFINHLRSNKFFPTPSEIIASLDVKYKHLGSDEAWAMMPRSEFESVVWTEEMAAAYAVAFDLINEGDRIAARMAFKNAYERLCNEASLMQKPVVWTVCKGYDKSLIEPVLQKAVLQGRITQEVADKHLPAPQDAGVIARLISGKVTDMPHNNENLRSRWKQLSQAMKDGQKRLAESKQQEILDREIERKNKEIQNKHMIEKAEQLLIDAEIEA